MLSEFELPACVIIKHNNPCGAAVAGDVTTAYQRARDCDPVSAYGGVVVVNRPVDGALGEMLAGTFVEVLCAPGYDDAALRALTVKPTRGSCERASGAAQPGRAGPAPRGRRPAGAGPRRRERGPLLMKVVTTRPH